MNMLMLSCKRATELIEKRSILKLGIVEKIQLKMHLSMCKACTQYGEQSQFIDIIIDKEMKSSENTSNLKKKIINKLDEGA